MKYLIIGALSTSFTVFGIALVYGISHTLNFGALGGVAAQFGSKFSTATSAPFRSATSSGCLAIPPNLHQTVLRAAPELPRSLAVVPLIRDHRYYGETPMRVR